MLQRFKQFGSPKLLNRTEFPLDKNVENLVVNAAMVNKNIFLVYVALVIQTQLTRRVYFHHKRVSFTAYI